MTFAAGLIGTGLFHRYVVSVSDGMPGYIFPAGHILAPLVSLAAYSISLLGAWGVAKALQHKRGRNPQE